MSLELSKPSGESRVDDVRALRFRVRDVDLTGTTYQDDQSATTVTAEEVGLKRILLAIPDGAAAAADLTSACPVAVEYASDHQSVSFALYVEESTAAGGALLEHGDATAVPTGARFRCLFIGS